MLNDVAAASVSSTSLASALVPTSKATATFAAGIAVCCSLLNSPSKVLLPGMPSALPWMAQALTMLSMKVSSSVSVRRAVATRGHLTTSTNAFVGGATKRNIAMTDAL